VTDEHAHDPYEAAREGCEVCAEWVAYRAESDDACGSPDCPYCPGNMDRL